YYAALQDETDPEEWEAFCKVAAKRHGWRFLPGVAELHEALRAFQGEEPLDVEAITAYDRVLGAGVYTAEGSTSWTFQRVRETCGPAAAEAFLAAGGHHAFATTYRESQRREAFLAAYMTAVRADPSTRLLPAPAARQALLAPAEKPTRSEASDIVRQI